jgi:hypothetical protein
MRRIKVDISTSTRGVIVLAKGRSDYGDWLVMVTRVDDIGSGVLKIYGHIFYSITEKVWYFSNGDENYAWGNINHWDFFEPTKEQKQKIVDALREKGYKYVPVLNKIIYKR